MAHIARRAGVTQPLVHYHFSSKDALWRAAVDNVLGLVSHGVEALRCEVEGRPGPEQLELILRAMVRFNAACPEFGRIVAYEGALGGERLQYLFEKKVDVPYLDAGELLREGAREGWAKPLPVEHVVIAAAAAARLLLRDQGDRPTDVRPRRARPARGRGPCRHGRRARPARSVDHNGPRRCVSSGIGGTASPSGRPGFGASSPSRDPRWRSSSCRSSSSRSRVRTARRGRCGASICSASSSGCSTRSSPSAWRSSIDPIAS